MAKRANGEGTKIVKVPTQPLQCTLHRRKSTEDLAPSAYVLGMELRRERQRRQRELP